MTQGSILTTRTKESVKISQKRKAFTMDEIENPHNRLWVKVLPLDIYLRVCQRWEAGEKRAIDDDDQTRLFILDPSGQMLTNLILVWERQQREEPRECDRPVSLRPIWVAMTEFLN